MFARRTAKNSDSLSPHLRLERLLKLVSLIESGQPRTGSQLAEAFSVCRRTVLRDIQLLRTANVPITFDTMSGGYRLHRQGMYVSAESGTAPMSLRIQNGEVCGCPKIKAEEVVALLLAVKSAASSVPREIAAVCDIALAKILAATMPAVREQVTTLLRQGDTDREQPQPDILPLRPSG